MAPVFIIINIYSPRTKYNNKVHEEQLKQVRQGWKTALTAAVKEKNKTKTRKRAIAKALQLKGHSDFVPLDLAYYQHFLFFLFQNIAFWEVPPGNHKRRLAYLILTRGVANIDKGRGTTPFVNNK